ncbi:MAG: acyl-CoA dehydrogenase [Polyangiales bacterium]
MSAWAPNLLLSEEQQMLSRTAREFVAQRAPASRLRHFRDTKDPVGFSPEVWREMAGLGWLGLQIPADLDGLGLGFFDLCAILEASGRELMPEPFVSTLLLGTQALLLGGSREQKAALLPGIAAGDTIVGLAVDERAARGDFRSVETTAAPVANGFEINGEKTHVLDGHVADQLLVSAQVAEERIALFLVDRRASGVTVTRQLRIDGHNAAIVRFDRCQVSADASVGSLGAGDDLLQRVFDRGAIGLASHMLGAAEQAFEDTLAYIKERVQFDSPIGSFQALQHRAVDLYTELALLRAVVLAGARAVDEQPDEVPRLASLANALASETFLHVAKEAIQMHGGIGVTDEHDIGFYLKRAQATYMTFGEPSRQRHRWAALHGY